MWWRGLNLIRRTIYRLPAVRRNIIPLGTRVRLSIKQRLPQHFVRLERSVYPLRLVRPLKIAHLRRLPLHMATKLGRVLVEPIRSAV